MSSGGGTPAKTDQVSKVELPPWVNAASMENYNLAKSIAERPLQQYGGPTVAGTSPMTQAGWDQIVKSVGSTGQMFDKATGNLDLASMVQRKSLPLLDDSVRLQDKAGGILDKTLPIYDKATGLYDKAGGLVDKGTGYLDRSGATLDKAGTFYDASGRLIDRSTGFYDEAGGIQREAGDIFRSTAGPLDITGFLNPYTQEVEDRAIANANRANDRAALATADKTRRAGAFGGSRGEIEAALTNAEGIRSIGDLTAQLRKAGIDYATDTAIADRTGRQAAGTGLLSTATGLTNTGGAFGQAAAGMRDTGAGFANIAAGERATGDAFGAAADRTGSQAAGLTNVGAGITNTARGVLDNAAARLATVGSAGSVASGLGSTAAGYGNTATTRQAADQTDIGNLLTAGSQEQSARQAEIDAAMKKFYEMRDYPLEGLNTRLAALGMSPYGKTETSNKTATSEDKGIDWASVLLGGAGLGLQAFKMSDRTMKTDIEKVADGDIPLYAFRYKNDPKTYPKVVGVMAQDVEKVVPKAVKKIGGKKAVNYETLLEALA